MNKKYLPFILLALIIALYALMTPSATSIRVQPERATPTPPVTPAPTPTPVPTSTPTPLPIPSEYVLISKKNEREKLDAVSAMQLRLRELGYYAGEADGYYGDTTFSAVVAFQRNNGMKVDGLAGEDTQRLLFEGENLIDASGRVHVPFVEITRAPTPTPSPTPPTLSMDSFAAGPKLNEQLFGGTWYDDGTIDARYTAAEGGFMVKVKVNHPSQLQSALAGSYALPAHAKTDRLCAANNAVVGFAGPDYSMDPEAYEVRQGFVLRGKPGSSPLLTVDRQGELRVFSAQGAARGVSELGDELYQAISVPKALIISGIVQPGLSSDASSKKLAIGQADGVYVLLYAQLSEEALAEALSREGCETPP